MCFARQGVMRNELVLCQGASIFPGEDLEYYLFLKEWLAKATNHRKITLP
jgi:hypothetical protein